MLDLIMNQVLDKEKVMHNRVGLILTSRVQKYCPMIKELEYSKKGNVFCLLLFLLLFSLLFLLLLMLMFVLLTHLYYHILSTGRDFVKVRNDVLLNLKSTGLKARRMAGGDAGTADITKKNT